MTRFTQRLRRKSRQQSARRPKHRRIFLEPLEQRNLLAVLFADSFEHGQWNGNWVEDGQNDWFTSMQRSTDGSYSAEVDGLASNATLTMASGVDFTGFNSVELTFDWLIESRFDSGEYVSVDISSNGGASWQTDVRRLNGNVDVENTWHSESVDLTPYASSDVMIRFRAKASRSNEDANVDNVQIVGTSVPQVSISDATAIEGDTTLRFIDQFIADGSGNLDLPRQTTFGPDLNSDGIDDLYVTSVNTDEILAYDGASGAFLQPFVSGETALDEPLDLQFSPQDGHLYVSSNTTNEVLRFDGQNGTYIDSLAAGLSRPAGLTFTDDGTLYIANRDTDEVLRYDGHSLSTFISSGSGGLDNPRRAVFGPDGNGDGNEDVYVASEFTNQVLRYDGTSGAFLDVFSTIPLGQGPQWLEFGDDGVLYGTSRTTSECCDRSIVRIDSNGNVMDATEFGAGWSFQIAEDGLLYNSSNAFGSFVNRIGAASLAVFTVSLSAPGNFPVTVNVSTADVTAAAGFDYAEFNGTLTFAPGQTSRTIIVPTIDDSFADSNETFTVTLSNPVGATIADDTALGTIIDDGDPTTHAKFFPLGFLPGQTESGGAPGMSPDGQFVVGNQGDEAFRWSRDEGLISLGQFDADDVSADGTVVVGGDGDINAYRWENGVLTVVGDLTTIGRTENDPGGTRMASVHGVSADGTIMVGNTKGDVEADSFRISASTIEPIGDLPGGVHNSGARSVSDDGSVVVGRGNSVNGDEAYRWENGVFTPLGDLPGGDFFSLSWFVSGNGEYVVGQSESDVGLEAYLWSSQSGMVGLGHLPGETTDSRARGVSGDGSIVVGIANHGQSGELRDAFIWDAQNGMRSLQDVLINEFGLGDALAGWTLNSALSISADGLIISGGATNPSGVREAFLVDLTPDTPLPELPPVADNDAYVGQEDASLNIAAPGVLDGDTDANHDPLTAVLVSQATHGVVALSSDGSFTYAPNADYNGTDSFTYMANDGTSNSNVATVNLTISPVNDAPTADGQSVGTTEDVPLAITLSGNDIEGDSLSYIVVASPSNGLLSGSGANRTYTPAANFNGSDSFTFKVNDGQADSAVVTVEIAVSAVNDAPVAAANSYSLDQDTTFSVVAPGVLANDSDVDGDSLTASLVATTPHGSLTLAADGSFEYTPNPGYVGPDSFSYQAHDGTTGGNTVVVALTVDAVSTGPNLSHGVVNVGSDWETVVLSKTYASMVVIATPNYDSGSAPAVTRIQNTTGNSFEIRIDAAGPTAVGDMNVHYIVVEEGVYDEPGYKLEAVKYNSTVTDENNSWSGESRSYQQAYSNPVVVGQVMTYNDSDWSVFWTAGGSRTAPPSSSALTVGKNVGEDPDNTRADEIIGYLVIETSTSGEAEIEGLPYVAAVGGDSVKGVGDAPAYSYSYSAMPNSKTAVASQAGMDGGNGGWAVLYGDNPITPTGGTINLAIDEDQMKDTERSHTTEQVAYFIIDPPTSTEAENQVRLDPVVSASKSQLEGRMTLVAKRAEVTPLPERIETLDARAIPAERSNLSGTKPLNAANPADVDVLFDELGKKDDFFRLDAFGR